jgi:predicted S18 family serine protease
VPFGHVAALREPVRDMPVGASHTLMVALAAYAHTSGRSLAPGWTLAGTGALDPLTGAVTRVGGLRLKAKAAHQDGATLLLYPAAQRGELDGLRTPGMRRISVHSLDEAIGVLEQLGAHRSSPGQAVRTRSADRAAWYPQCPWTPPPGGVDEEHRNNPGTPVR